MKENEENRDIDLGAEEEPYAFQDHATTWMPGDVSAANEVRGLQTSCSIMLLDVNVDTDEEQILVDPGAFDHACPPTFAPEIPIMLPITEPRVFTAGKAESLQLLGMKTLKMLIGNHIVQCVFQVIDIRRVLLSVASLMRHGFKTVFEGKNTSYIGRGRWCRMPLRMQGSHFFLSVKVLTTQSGDRRVETLEQFVNLTPQCPEPQDAAEHWAENVLRWTGRRPTTEEIEQRQQRTLRRQEMQHAAENRAEEPRNLPDLHPQEVQTVNMAEEPRRFPDSQPQELRTRNRAEEPQRLHIAACGTATWHLFEWCCDKQYRLASRFLAHGQQATRFCFQVWDCSKRENTMEAVRRICEAVRMGMYVLVWIPDIIALHALESMAVREHHAQRAHQEQDPQVAPREQETPS